MNKQDPNIPQRKAANPEASVWVGASAGSGKTKVLTERVLNLLLSGTPAEKILCLTYTRTTAAQMANKITEKLSHWACAEEDVLRKELFDLRQEEPSEERIKQARRLFAELLNTAGGLKATTIHGFCQSLLKRFPLEAKIAPEFDVIDDVTAKELIAQAQEKVFKQAQYQSFLKTIIQVAKQDDFLEELKNIMEKPASLKAFAKKYPAPQERQKAYETAFNLPEKATEETLENDFLTLSSERESDLRFVLKFLEDSSKKTDIKMHDALAMILSKQCEKIASYSEFFLTKSGTIRATLICGKNEEALRIISQEAKRVSCFYTQISDLKMMQNSLALIEVSLAILKEYRLLKDKHSYLDYEDLITLTKELLEKSGSAAWVLFKLDGGIDHILVDEAQDTSPSQWAIVQALAEEFFSGDSLRSINRTLFAVGDKKQSIFSFQGAEPLEFNRMKNFFKQKIAEAGKSFEEVPMNTSFRSGQSVIDMVNFVFQKEEARQGVAEGGEDITHIAFRQGQASRFELWPTEKYKEESKEENEEASQADFSKPLERVFSQTPMETLAHKMALKIKKMIEEETLEAENRKIRPKDILILVQKRGAFVETISRELKSLGVEVAGVDRLKITQHIAVQDLMILGDFLLLPEDDLALATILRSPLCGISESDLSKEDLKKTQQKGFVCNGVSEEELFQLAYNRKGSLFEALASYKDRPETSLGKAYLFLKDLLARVDNLRPFELYSYVLGALGKQKNFVARLGVQALDALDEFLSLALKFDSSNAPSLQNFLYTLRQEEVEIKRDSDQSSFDAVRIMTVHSSKGLEAPIVFLPNTRQYFFRSPKSVWNEEGLGLWAPTAKNRNQSFTQQLDVLKNKNVEENHRLLYVALTRAADRLYFSGWENKKKAPKENWYDLVEQAFYVQEEGDESPVCRAQTIQDELFNKPVLALSSLQEKEPASKKEKEVQGIKENLPAWAFLPPKPEPTPTNPLTPSKLTQDEPASLSPLADQRALGLKRGILVHTLLEQLPKYPNSQRQSVASKILEAQKEIVGQEEQNHLLKKVFEILNTPTFAPLFSEASLAEVSVSGSVEDKIVNAKIDRLCVTEKEVLIVDYKSNLFVPRTLEETPLVYREQLGLYKKLLEQIYPQKEVKTFLLWTEEAQLQEITSLV